MRKFCWFVLLVCGCIYFESIVQPTAVAVGERFTITIKGSYVPAGCPGIWWLAMMTPKGFDIDSIRFLSSDSLTGIVTEIDTGLTYEFENLHPSDTNMFWRVYSTQGLSADSNGTYTIWVYAYATPITIPAQYLLDYYIGHFIGCGSSYSDSLLNRAMTVNPSGVAMDIERPTNRRRSIYPSVFRDRLNICTHTPDIFTIYSSDGRCIKDLHVEYSGFWDGRDERGTRVPVGNYFITGKGGTTKVTLVE